VAVITLSGVTSTVGIKALPQAAGGYIPSLYRVTWLSSVRPATPTVNATIKFTTEGERDNA